MGFREWLRDGLSEIGIPFDMRRSMRDEWYREAFGEPARVEIVGGDEYLRLYVFPLHEEGEDDPTWLVITGGMSDLQMRVPKPAARAGFVKRVELMMFVPDPTDAMLYNVGTLAGYPSQDKTWLGPFHVIPTGLSPEDLPEQSQLTSVLLTECPVDGLEGLEEALCFQGVPMQLLNLVPITAAEHELAVRDTDQFMQRLDARYFLRVDWSRPSAV